VFASATFAVIFVHDECPRLSPLLKFLGDLRYRIRGWLSGIVIVIQCNIHFTIFIIDSLIMNEQSVYRQRIVMAHGDY
jgi:hypothetical protein